MGIGQEEARETLSQIRDVVERTKKLVAYGGADTQLVVWGVIWVLGCLGTHFMPLLAHWLWLVLVGTGFGISVIVERRRNPVKSPVAKRIAWLWFLLFVYVGLWFALLSPFMRVRGADESMMFQRHFGAICATVPMFAYVVMGLWLDNFIIWIGLVVTALTILGLFLIESYFFVWMAVMGGGTLIGTGLFIRNRWR